MSKDKTERRYVLTIQFVICYLNIILISFYIFIYYNCKRRFI